MATGGSDGTRPHSGCCNGGGRDMLKVRSEGGKGEGVRVRGEGTCGQQSLRRLRAFPHVTREDWCWEKKVGVHCEVTWYPSLQ